MRSICKKHEQLFSINVTMQVENSAVLWPIMWPRFLFFFQVFFAQENLHKEFSYVFKVNTGKTES